MMSLSYHFRHQLDSFRFIEKNQKIERVLKMKKLHYYMRIKYLFISLSKNFKCIYKIYVLCLYNKSNYHYLKEASIICRFLLIQSIVSDE